MVPKPTEPVPRSDPALRVRGRYKEASADFVVEEVPAYEPSGEGDHTYLWIEKEGLSTFDAVRALAEALHRREAEFGFAGMKDAHAVTRQWISIERADPARLRDLALPGVRVLDVRRHRNKLKLGHLRGNRFAIRLAGTSAADAPRAERLLHELARVGAPNYFGEQRFGKRGANLDKGLRILHGNPHQAARTMPKRLLGLVVSAVQSEVFNRVVIRRLGELGTVQRGDVAWLHHNGACFLVEDEAREQPRCESFEISPSGPLPGPRLLEARGRPGEVEAEVLAEMELDRAIFGKMPHGTHEGARRPLRVPVVAPRVEVDGSGELRVSFELPRGSYATAVLRELLVETPWFG